MCSVLCKAALGCSLEATQAASMPPVFPVSAIVAMIMEVVRFSSPHLLQWLMWDPSGGPVFTSGGLKPLATKLLPASGLSSTFFAGLVL